MDVKEMECEIPTPWGKIKDVRRIAPGFFEVRTAMRAGGYIVSESFAKRNLSDAALSHGHRYGRYFCFAFVTDGTWAIVPFELPEFRETLLEGHFLDQEPEVYLLAILSEERPAYLLDRGIEPNPEGLERWELQQAREQALIRRDPDLIVTAKGEWRTGDPRVVEVITADGAAHRVTRRSYEALEQDFQRLSECQKVGPGAADDLARHTLVEVLNELQNSGVRFYVEHVDGCHDLSPEQVLDHAEDPVGSLCGLLGVDRETHALWRAITDNPYCTGKTRFGEPCQNPIHENPRSPKDFRPGVSDRCPLHIEPAVAHEASLRARVRRRA